MSCAIRRDGDTVDDATVRWPEERPQRAFGEISLREIAANNASEQQNIIFDSIPRVDGIEASGDPLFEPRANIYLMSGRRPLDAGVRRGEPRWKPGQPATYFRGRHGGLRSPYVWAITYPQASAHIVRGIPFRLSCSPLRAAFSPGRKKRPDFSGEQHAGLARYPCRCIV